MRITGEWLACDDGARRPCVRRRVARADGAFSEGYFLIDIGADRTVFGAALLATLGLPTVEPPTGIALQGVGGNSPFVLLTTVLELTSDDGSPARVRGEFAAFIDPSSTDLHILGRDVLNHFDVIVSYRRNEVVLLAQNHRYVIEFV